MFAKTVNFVIRVREFNFGFLLSKPKIIILMDVNVARTDNFSDICKTSKLKLLATLQTITMIRFYVKNTIT